MINVLVNKHWALRAKRLALQKEVDALQEQETAVKHDIIRQLRADNITSAGTELETVTLIVKHAPTVREWPTIYKHIRESGEFDLLQRRLSEEAVKQRWERGLIVPGVEKFPVDFLSITNVKASN